MNVELQHDLREKHAKIVSLCEKHGVASLDLFGSGTTEAWRRYESDLDFVVTFQPRPDRSIADRYLGLAEDLEALFGRSVDLLTAGSIRNPYFKIAVDATRAPLYAA